MNDHVSLPIEFVIPVVKNWKDNIITADDALEQLLKAQDKIREEENANEH